MNDSEVLFGLDGSGCVVCWFGGGGEGGGELYWIRIPIYRQKRHGSVSRSSQMICCRVIHFLSSCALFFLTEKSKKVLRAKEKILKHE